MSKAYTELYYHLVWATWKRHPLLKPEIQDDLYRYIRHKSKEYGYHLYEVNGMENHMHIVVRLPPAVSVAEAAHNLKGSASHFCNDSLDLETPFKWQEGYGAFTFAKRDLAKIVSYVQNQKARHRDGRLNDVLENGGIGSGG